MNLDNQLASLLGTKGWIAAEDSAPWQRDWLNQFGEMPLGVARPSSTEEVVGVMEHCSTANVPVVPQGGNTCLTGAAVLAQPNGVLLSLSRMNKVLSLDKASGCIAVEAGLVLSSLHDHLDGSGLMFPLHIGAEGSAQVGGLIGTNAGGSHAFRFGMMQDLVIGLEVVLSDGRIWNGMRSVQKDNAGYQLRKLFCGAEGTLGIVTQAVLKLSSEPVQRVTTLLAVTDMSAALDVAGAFRQQAGECLMAMEFFSDLGLNMALDNIPNLTMPLSQRSSIYVLIEAATGSGIIPLESIFADILESSIDQESIIDGVLAMSEKQRNELWRLREEQPEGQRREGRQLKHDISIPPGRLAEFLTLAAKECQEILEGLRINPFGHLGDGNVHYNLSPPHGQDHFSGHDREFAFRLGKLASEMGGSFAAEHGLGRSKVALADEIRDPVERSIMARLKSALNESGNLNPGVIVAE